MKTIFLISLSAVLLIGRAVAQGPCATTKVETPAVAKPTNGAIVSVTCSTLVVAWQGAANQLYVAQATYFNTAANKTDTALGINISCTGSFSCTATIPVIAGTNISWSVQATATIDDRTFYSYPFRGEQDYAIPACFAPVPKPAIVKKVQPKSDEQALSKLLVFPNPVTGILTINWQGEFKGAATIFVANAAGKEIRKMNVRKVQSLYTSQLQVSTLAPGIYYLQIRTTGGESLSTSFVKE